MTEFKNTPSRSETQNILGSWRSCKTDRDRYGFIQRIKVPYPEIAVNFTHIMEESNAEPNPSRVESPIRNQTGFFILNIAIFLLLLVGSWFLWHSFSQGNLRNDAQSIYNDYTNVVTNHILPKFRR